ncbi:putative barnase/colicin E5 family endoribonuclease [Ideonella livida]|uniref:Phage-Barnase-EndoU-ColicinE5/D-RelE-like nuclease domain-containing protein n=1 Tax=Ideonella livida TaxID=2707176 RepID=A0A7C9PEP6_9BURK|nr:hypothetical protein [Ideonella livida]NDY89711.1 hypothetical protein [Ideonella livida]
MLTEFRNNPEGAIEKLLREHTGEARAVWERTDLGVIDLIYGDKNSGLAHIEAKHPEMIPKLPDLIRFGKLVKKPGARKVFLIREGVLPEIAVISLDWFGDSKTWVVTSYVDVQGKFSGSLKTMNTEALDSAQVEILYATQRTAESLLDGDELFNVDDLDPSDLFDPDDEWSAIPPEDAAFDGDFPGHPFRGNQYRKAASTSGSAVRASQRAKHAETKGHDAQAQKKSHRTAYHAHMAAASEADTPKAKAYHATMAKFHAKRAGVRVARRALDSVMPEQLQALRAAVVEAVGAMAKLRAARALMAAVEIEEEKPERGDKGGASDASRAEVLASLAKIAAGTHPKMMDPSLMDEIESALTTYPGDAEVEAAALAALDANEKALLAATA